MQKKPNSRPGYFMATQNNVTREAVTENFAYQPLISQMFQIYLKLSAAAIKSIPGRTRVKDHCLLPLDNGSQHQMKALHRARAHPHASLLVFQVFFCYCCGAPVGFNCLFYLWTEWRMRGGRRGPSNKMPFSNATMEINRQIKCASFKVKMVSLFYRTECIKLCFNKKSFLKNLAGHLAQLNWALRALETAIWFVLRWTSKLEFWVNLSPHRLHLKRALSLL